MMIPIRCQSCGKPIGQTWERFNTRVHKKGENAQKVLDDLDLKRYCCRATLMGHVDLIDEVAKFKKF
jgi:DNA-directed RNA polymerase subunit N